MTSRERLLTAIHRGTPDRVPIGPYTLGRLDFDAPFTREFIRAVDPLVDTGCGGNMIWGQSAPFEKLPLEHVRDQVVEVIVLHTPKGNLLRKTRRTKIMTSQTEFFCKTPEDAEKVLSVPFTPPSFNLKEYFRQRESVGDEGLVLIGIPDGICWVAELYSPEDFSMLWIDAPDVMRKLVRTAADRINAATEELAKSGVEAFRIVGGEYASVQLGPTAFEELVVEPDAELCDIIRKNGAVSYFHNHGPVTRYYDAFRRIGMDALDPLEAPPWGDCDLAEAKRRIGSDICMVGNLDDMEILEKLPWEEIEPIARERLSAGGPDAFIFGGTASGTYTEIGARNFMRLVPLAEEMVGRWV